MTEKHFEEKYICNPETIRKVDVEAYHEAAHLGGTSSKYLYASILSHFTEVNIERAIKVSDYSMFIIGGEDDKDMSQIIEDYTVLNPAIEAVTVKGCKKLIHVEAPEKIVDYCDIFL